jgi:predicted LPLAT superfamily acyltransferase
VYIRPLDTTIVQQKGSRQEKAAHLAQLFADEVGEIVRKYPTQWFNYYEFWNNDEI